MNETENAPVRSKLFLALFFVAYFFVAIWADPISGNDEPRVAGIAREMALSGEYEYPQLNGEPFLEYPSLGYIPYALLFAPFERPTDFLAHLIPALFGLATLYFTFRMGCLLGGRALGIASALALATSFGFTHLMARVLVDPILLFFVTMSLWGFLSLMLDPPKRFSWALLCFYGGMSCGLLTKGLIGAAVPGAVALIYLLWRRQRENWTRLRPFTGALVSLAVLGIWAFEIANEFGWQALGEFARQSIWRFASATADHAKPIYGYALPLLYVLLPWSLLFFFLLWLRWGKAKWKEGLALGGTQVFPAIWFLTVLAALSLASAKRNVYLAPLYPAFALMTGIWWTRLQGRYAIGERTVRLGLASILILVAVVKFFFILPEENAVSWREPMHYLVEDSSEEEIVLFRPSESLRGAAVYYLGRSVPSVQTMEELRRLMRARPGSARVVALFEGVKEVRESLKPEEILGTREWIIGRRDLVVFRVAGERKGGG